MKAILLPIVLCFCTSLVAAQQRPSTNLGRLANGDHYAAVQAIRIWYTVVGTGPLIVVQAPGWGPSSTYLQNGLLQLSQHFTLLFYDPRGNGRSNRPKDEAKMKTSDMVEDLEQLRQYWGLKTMTLMGHSHGGAIALGYAVRYPHRLHKLILVDAEIPGYDVDAEVKKNIEARRNDSRFAEAIVAAADDAPVPKTDEEFGAYLHRLLPLYFFDPDSNLARFEKTQGGLPSVWAYTSLGAADTKEPLHVIGLMRGTTARTLILVGREDFGCPPSGSERIHSEIKRSRLVVFERTGHFPWIEDPDEFFKEVSIFTTKTAISTCDLRE
jgi:proline iminopeptidase